MLGCSRSMLESDSSLQNTTTWWATTLSAWGCADCWMWFYMWYYIPSRPNDVKDCLILLDLMLTSSPSTGKCEPGFSATNHLKCNLWTPCQTWYKALFRPCNEGLQTEILLSVTDFVAQRQRDTFWRYSYSLQAFPHCQKICWCSFQEPQSC